MSKKEIMNEIVGKLGANRWEEKSCFGFTHFYIHKGIETIEDFSSIYEAEFYLNYHFEKEVHYR